MTAHDLLDMVGDAKGEYIWQAQQHREHQPRPQPKTVSFRKVWFIAAIIALMLLLVGCVAYVLSLNDLVLGQRTEENRLTGEMEVHSVLSLHGFAGTPGYQASKEWYEWEQAYDPDGSIRNSEEAYSEDFGEEYEGYSLYTREMKEKVDEICEKYDLKLLGKLHADPDTAKAFEAIGIQDIVKADALVETDYFTKTNAITYYENGSFEIEASFQLTGESNPWPCGTLLSFRCTRKDTFDDYYESVGPEGTYEEWTYRTSDGIDVLLVMEEHVLYDDSAFMMADVGDFVFIVSLYDTHLDKEYDIGKADMEALAEAFDFSVQPQSVSKEDAAASDERYQQQFVITEEDIARGQAEWDDFVGKESYEARVEFHLLSDKNASGWAIA